MLRSLHPDQPIVENFVGRQTPTAMVARNLERGSGFLRPQLDTGPFPNYFLVEPPIYQELAVALRRTTGLSLDACGRLTSAAAAALAAWGVYALMKRRWGEGPALAAATAFSMLPITIRYGRAFQPDALMIGACAAGLACWDLAVARGGGRRWLAAGWLLLAVGLAAKATAAYVLAVAFLAIFPRRTWKTIALCASPLAPAIAWYAWAGWLTQSSGSRAAAENQAIWMDLIGLEALASGETWRLVGRFLVVRAFTPLGFAGALWGLWSCAGKDRGALVWWTWAGLASATMALLAAKLHHEYYWLCMAPVAAAGLGLAWARIDAWRPTVALAAAAVFAALALYVADSTWNTPDEWAGLAEAARGVSEETKPGDLVVAPEALLYRADRRGCRLEYTLAAASRAASEWGPINRGLAPIELVEFYRTKGARWFADLGSGPEDVLRVDLHDGIRRRYKVLIDRPDLILAELPPSEPSGHGD
ncbi:ArnT family glycosyltransferase [Paludisphaera mucosa]|uniref:Glycosyltransferase family 39 protein n=1 Tax=Paludisphaera mucosa TaxID=3030827 RepID=A0ABT6F8J4_9BACT|nr:glycosyltransferase family 39 protein [Paludisphaera mucosa]